MRDHPESHLLDDWYLYGPRNPEVFRLVSQLVREKGMRVSEIESVIETTLRKKLDELSAPNIN